MLLGGCSQKKVKDYHAIIGIDPGHGGRDNGAIRENINEDEINLALAKKLKKLLEANNYKVIMTRVDDHDLADEFAEKRKLIDLKRRVVLFKENDVDLFVSIHLNICDQVEVHGAQVFTQINKHNSDNFAKLLQEKLNKEFNNQKKVKNGDYHILRNSDLLGVLVECGFLSNSDERSLLQKSWYQDKIVYVIFLAINEFFLNIY